MSSKLFAVVKMKRDSAQLYDAKIKGNLPEIIFEASQNMTTNIYLLQACMQSPYVSPCRAGWDK